MKTEEAIKAWIRELQADTRLKQPTATVFENAPLALIQLSLETQISTLEDVINDAGTAHPHPVPRRAARGGDVDRLDLSGLEPERIKRC